MKDIPEKLGKIVELAKHGMGGEKDNAIRIVKRICKEHDLDFDDVMSQSEVQEFRLDIGTFEQRVAVQIILRYGAYKTEPKISPSVSGKHLYWKTTKERYVETLNAFAVLSSAYKKEKKRMADIIFHGFLSKHSLYYKPTPEEAKDYYKANKELSEEEKKVRAMGDAISNGMDDVTIQKLLE